MADVSPTSRRPWWAGGRGPGAAAASLAALLACAAPAMADYYNAVTAFDRGEYAAARAELEPLVAAGDPRAQFLLGRMYADGKGVVQDYVAAHRLLNLAAAAGLDGASAARDELAARMTPDQVAEAQRQAAGAALPPLAGPPLAAPLPAPASTATAAAQVAAPVVPNAPGLLEGQGLVDLQWQLALHGYDPGPADGRIGPGTVTAIRHYQADAGLAVDGRPTRALLDHLQFTVPAVRNAAAQPVSSPSPPRQAAVLPGPLDQLDVGLKRAYVVGIQQALEARGYRPGPADGVAGQRTRAAIRRYQSDAGLPVDGQPTPELLNRLKFVGGRVAS